MRLLASLPRSTVVAVVISSNVVSSRVREIQRSNDRHRVPVSAGTSSGLRSIVPSFGSFHAFVLLTLHMCSQISINVPKPRGISSCTPAESLNTRLSRRERCTSTAAAEGSQRCGEHSSSISLLTRKQLTLSQESPVMRTIGMGLIEVVWLEWGWGPDP